MPTAVEGVSGGDDKSSQNDQQRDQVSHGDAKKGIGKHWGARAKASSRPTPETSAEMWFRDTSLHHMTFADEMFRSRGWLPEVTKVTFERAVGWGR
jgi:hypothetical protein